MKLLTNEQQNSYQNSKIYYICREKIEDKHAKDKKFWKVKEFIVIKQENIEVLHIVYVI